MTEKLLSQSRALPLHASWADPIFHIDSPGFGCYEHTPDYAEVVEFGRHAILRGWWATPVRVQIPASAPHASYYYEREIHHSWLESATFVERARSQVITYPMR